MGMASSSATTAPIKASASAPGTLAPAPSTSRIGAVVAAIGSDLLDLGPPEETFGPENEHDRQDGEGGHVLVFRADVAGPEHLDEPDQQSAQHGARQRA